MILHGKAMAPIAVRALSVAYRGETALWNVNWTVASGRTTAIVGPNGAGKSTLLNAITGLVPSLAGEASFWGQSFADARRRIAYVPQRESVDWDFPVTAREVVEMGARRDLDWVLPGWMRRALKGDGRTFDRRVDEALARVQMTEYGDRPIGELSGGQQQRVFLARALAQDADLLLLDEPFAGVDVTTEAILTNELRRLAEQGRTIVVVHHDLDDVAERFDDVVVLDGTVVASGPARATMTPELIGRVFGGRAAQGESLVASAR